MPPRYGLQDSKIEHEPAPNIKHIKFILISYLLDVRCVSLICRFRMLQSGTIKQTKCWIWINFSHLHGLGYFQTLLVLSQLGQAFESKSNLSQLKM